MISLPGDYFFYYYYRVPYQETMLHDAENWVVRLSYWYFSPTHSFNRFTRVSYGDIKAILTFESVDETQMKPCQQFFLVVLFTFQYFTNKIWDSS